MDRDEKGKKKVEGFLGMKDDAVDSAVGAYTVHCRTEAERLRTRLVHEESGVKKSKVHIAD